MLGGGRGANLAAMGRVSITARRVGQPLRIAAWLVTESGVAYRSPEFTDDGVLLLNATQRAVFIDDGTLSVANGAELTEEILSLK